MQTNQLEKKYNLLLRGLVTLFFGILVYTFFGEKTVNEGAGYDGLYYRDIVRNFPAMLADSFSDYKASRILPFAIAHYLLSFLDINPTDLVVLNTIWLMIFSLLLLAVIYYFKIANQLQWRKDIQAIGFIVLFFNFAILKYIGYYPILTDHFIFSITIIILYYWLRKQWLGMMLPGFAACFIWPTYSLFIPLLLLNNPVGEYNGQATGKTINLLWKLCKIGLAMLPIAIFVYLIREQNLWVDRRYLTADRYAIFRPYNFVISLISFAALYFYYLILLWPVSIVMLRSFLNSIFKTRLIQIVLAVIFIVTVYTVKYFLTSGNTEAPYPTLKDLLGEFTFRPAVSPFNFLVFGFWFLGFMLFFIAIYYRQLLEEFLKMGNGYFILFIYTLIFLTTAQPRYIATMLPFLLLPVLQVLHARMGNKWAEFKYVLVFAIAALLVSRFWFPIELNDHYMQDGNTFAEKYPMFIGPWISDKFYIILGSIAVILFSIWGKFIHQPMLRSSSDNIHGN